MGTDLRSEWRRDLSSDRLRPIVTIRIFFAALALMTAAGTLSAQSTGQELPDYQRSYVELRDRTYNSENPDRLGFLYRRALQQARGAHRQGTLDDVDLAYWVGQIEYMMGRAWQAVEENEQADEHYESGLETVESALEERRTSELLRLQSDTISQLCLVRGLGYTILNGPRVGPLAQEALELDPDNGKAIIILASAKVYPPPIFGGNPTEGIRLMREALEKPNIDKDDRFNILSGIGVALGKLNRESEARRYLRRALDLYPENEFATEELSRLQ